MSPKLRSDNRNSEKTENGRLSGSCSTPIACCVCNKVFFDNVSLVLHFECHVKEGFRLRGRDLAALRSCQHFSSRWSPYSYSLLARVFARMNDRLRSRPLRVPSKSTPTRAPVDPNLLYLPVLNVSQPFSSRCGATPSSACPLMCSQLGVRDFASGSAMAPHLREHRDQEIIVISDDEEDENKKIEEIDFTLKL